ncbi:MAG: tetratricopeptide repeat protein [Pseudomonadota bacterium]
MKRSLLALICLTLPLTAFGLEARIEPVESAIDAGDWKRAIKLAEDWVDDDPDNALAQYWLAVSRRVKMENVNRMRAMATIGGYKRALTRAIELDPQLVDARAERIGFLIHAPGIAGGDRDEARREIEALRAIDPREAADMQLELARVEEDMDGVLAALEQIQALEPERDGVKIEVALIHISQSRYQDAEELLLACADSDEPGVSLGAQYQRARWRVIAEEDTTTAATLLENYLTTRGDEDLPYAPDRSAAFWRLGLAQEMNGQQDLALSSLEQSVALNDEFEPAQEDLKRMQRGR